ncbi:hypothetical protein LCGC14_3098760 [marine sediment metagenome]|uniref:Uncharacterized protein n=1 Tax=marine sediment metagenome TaxID=412755 RepID=A0A0F8YFT9_9ZZZZ
MLPKRLLSRLHLRRPPRYDALWRIVDAVRQELEEYAEDCRGGLEAGFWAEHDELPFVEAALRTVPKEFEDSHGEWLGRVALFLDSLWD